MKDKLIETINKDDVYGVVMNINTYMEATRDFSHNDVDWFIVTDRRTLQMGIYARYKGKPICVSKFVDRDKKEIIPFGEDLCNKLGTSKYLFLKFLHGKNYKDSEKIKKEVVEDYLNKIDAQMKGCADRVNYYLSEIRDILQ